MTAVPDCLRRSIRVATSRALAGSRFSSGSSHNSSTGSLAARVDMPEAPLVRVAHPGEADDLVGLAVARVAQPPTEQVEVGLEPVNVGRLVVEVRVFRAFHVRFSS